MKQPKSTEELTPLESADIVWLYKSGYTPEAIARETGLPLAIIEARLYEAGRL
jgi:hypothetical protein